MDSVEIKVSKDLIAPILEAKIKGAVLGALGDPKVFMDAAVEAMLARKVNSEGKQDRYGDGEYNLVDILCQRTIRDCIEKEIIAWFGENKPLLREAIKNNLKRSTSRLAKALVDGMTESFAKNYRLDFKVQIPEQ